MYQYVLHNTCVDVHAQREGGFNSRDVVPLPVKQEALVDVCLYSTPDVIEYALRHSY